MNDTTMTAEARESDCPLFPCADGDPAAVRVLATNYGPAGWDGLPFSAWPAWLAEATTKSNVIRPVTPGSTDYAEWEVETSHGVVLASPGDWIASGHKGRLMVLREAVGLAAAERTWGSRVDDLIATAGRNALLDRDDKTPNSEQDRQISRIQRIRQALISALA